MARGQKTGGRQAGTPNKATVAAKQAMQLAFDGIGGVDGLTQWAAANPTDFYKLYARLIPVDVSGDVSIHHDITDEPMTEDEWRARYASGNSETSRTI